MELDILTPDLNRLRVFHFVFTERSIQAAADKLNVTRSAASQALKLLEEELGAALFVRNSKQVLPTAAAEALQAVVAPFLRMLQDATVTIARGSAEPSGLLRLGAPQEFGTRALVQACAKLRAAWPTVRFEITLGVPPTLLAGVTRGELDLAFVDNGDVFADQYPVTMQTVATEEFVLVGSARKRSYTYAELCDATYIEYVNTAPVLRMWLKHHFRKAPPSLAVALVVESVHGVLNSVRAGMGLGIVPAQLAQGLTIIRPAKSKPFVNRVMAARHKGRSATAAENALVRILTSA